MACFAAFGATTVKQNIMLSWMDGFIMKKDKSILTGLVLCFEQSIVTILILYLLFVSRDLHPLLCFATLFGVATNLLTVICLPESPKWLIQNDRQEDATKVYQRIACFNCAPSFAENIRVTDEKTLNDLVAAQK